MAWKIYKSGSFLVCENATTGDLKEFRSVDAQITKKKAGLDEYELVVGGAVELRLNLTDIKDANGDAYVEAVWDAFRYEQLGVDTDAAAVQTFAGLSDVTFGTPADGQAFVWDSGTSKVVPATVGDGYTETIVNISSAQILASGGTPIELLPAPTANTYYDIDKIIIEYIYNSVVYSFGAGNRMALTFGDVYRQFVMGASTSKEFIKITDMQLYQGLDSGFLYHVNNYDGQGGLYLTTWTGASPTNGNGTMRAKIYHKTNTFGA